RWDTRRRGRRRLASRGGRSVGTASYHHRHYAVRRSEVNTNRLRHVVNLLLGSLAPATRKRRGRAAGRRWAALHDVDLDLLGLDRLHLGKSHRKNAVPIASFHFVGLHGDGKLEETLHTTCPAFATEVVLRLHGLGILPLALETQHVSRDRDLNILLAHPGEVHLDHKLVLRLVHVRGWSPGALRHPRLCRAAEERVEEAIDLGLNVTDLPYPYPRLQPTPMHHRHR